MVTSIQEVYARNMQSLINEIGAYNNETVLYGQPHRDPQQRR